MINSYNICLQKGYSLAELMIAVSLIGILGMVGGPSLSDWLQNSKTRTTAESLSSGIGLAQAEAVRRGTQVQFFLTNATPSLNAPSDNAGKNWGIRSMSRLDITRGDTFIQGETRAASNPDIAITSTAPFIQFNSIGRVSNPLAGVTITIVNSNGSRKLNVVVSSSGSVRMCDPDVSRTTDLVGC